MLTDTNLRSAVDALWDKLRKVPGDKEIILKKGRTRFCGAYCRRGFVTPEQQRIGTKRV